MTLDDWRRYRADDLYRKLADDLGTKMNNRKPKILVVENELPVAMMMVSLLTRVGCDVEVACTEEKAMKMGLEEKFDLFVLDIDLPGNVNGFEVCSEFRQRHFTRHTPVVLVSGRASEQDQRHGYELGAVDFIGKPFEGRDFVRRLLSHVEPTLAQASNAVTDLSLASGYQSLIYCNAAGIIL